MAAPHVVIDTNVWVSAFRSRRGASYELVQMLGTDAFEAHVSVPLVLEHEKVFREQQGAMGLNEADCDRLLDLICRLSTHHEIYYLWRSQVRDPGDAHVLELAVASSAEAIITYNQRDFPDAATFGIDLLTSPAFLERIGAL